MMVKSDNYSELEFNKEIPADKDTFITAVQKKENEEQ